MRRADRQPGRDDRRRQVPRQEVRDRGGGRDGVDGDVVEFDGRAERADEADELFVCYDPSLIYI